MSETKRVLVSDELADEAVAAMRKAGLEVDAKPGLDETALAEAVGSYDGLVIRSATKVTKAVLARKGRLRIVVRAGVGVDNVDLEAARAAGVRVANTPGGSTNAVAELALGMILALAREIPAADRSMKAGRWEKKSFLGTEVAGKTLGIVGLGRIGLALAEKAQALGMTTIGCDPITPAEVAAKHGVSKKEQDEVFAASDYLSLHVPLLPETKHLVREETIARMKPGVRIVNCARGGVIDEHALAAALDSGHVAGAALDVYETEPPGGNSIAAHPKVVATPHIGAATREAQASVSTEAAEVMIAFLVAGEARNVVV